MTKTAKRRYREKLRHLSATYALAFEAFVAHRRLLVAAAQLLRKGPLEESERVSLLRRIEALLHK